MFKLRIQQRNIEEDFSKYFYGASKINLRVSYFDH